MKGLIRDDTTELKKEEIHTNKTQKNTAYYFLILFIGFSLCSVCNFHLKLIPRICGEADSNQVVFYRSFILSFISAIILRIENKPIPSYSKNGSVLWFTIRNISGYLSSISLILCLQYIRLSTALVFNALSPVLTCVFSVVIIKEKFYSRYIIGIIVCFSGCLMMIMNDRSSGGNPPLENYNNTMTSNDFEPFSKENTKILSNNNNDNIHLMKTLIGCCYGLIHTISLSLHQTSTKILLNQKIDNYILIFYLGVANCILSYLIWLFIGARREMWMNKCFVFNDLFNGVLFFSFTYFLNVGYKNLDLIQTAGLGYVVIIESFILGALFLGEDVYLTDFAGSLIIVIYNILNSYFPIKT
jgi:drug/metabolite transporter (DMT)-like permease